MLAEELILIFQRFVTIFYDECDFTNEAHKIVTEKVCEDMRIL